MIHIEAISEHHVRGDLQRTDDEIVAQMVAEAIIEGCPAHVLKPRMVFEQTLELRPNAANGTLPDLIFRGADYRDEAHHAGATIIGPIDAPAIRVHAARGGLIKGGLFVGSRGRDVGATDALGNPRLRYDLLPLGSLMITEEEAWGEDSRYDPYAGIVIDGVAGDMASTAVTIDGCNFDGFEAAVALQPWDAPDANCDFIRLHNTRIERCKYGVTVGTGQARNTAIRDARFENVWTCIVTTRHGSQAGEIGPVDNASGGGFVGRLFELGGTSRLDAASFRNLRVEGLHRIGDFTGASGEGTLAIDGMLNFRHAATGVVPANVLGGSCPAQIDIDARVSGTPCVSVMPPNVRWRGRIMHGMQAPAYHAALAVYGDPKQPVQHGLDATVAGQDVVTDERYRQQPLPYWALRATVGFTYGRITQIDIPTRFVNRQDFAHSVAGKTVTLTINSALIGNRHARAQKGWTVGSSVRCRATGAVAVIDQIAGTVATCTLLTNHAAGEATEPMGLFGFDLISAHDIAPAGPCLFRFTAGSADVQVLGGPHGLLAGDVLVTDACPFVTLSNPTVTAVALQTVTLASASPVSVDVTSTRWVRSPEPT